MDTGVGFAVCVYFAGVHAYRRYLVQQRTTTANADATTDKVVKGTRKAFFPEIIFLFFFLCVRNRETFQIVQNKFEKSKNKYYKVATSNSTP